MFLRTILSQSFIVKNLKNNIFKQDVSFIIRYSNLFIYLFAREKIYNNFTGTEHFTGQLNLQ